MRVFERCHQGVARKEGGGRGWREKLSEINTKAVSRVQNKLIGEFNMAADDVISIRGQVMEYTFIPTGIKRELVRFGVDCNWKG